MVLDGISRRRPTIYSDDGQDMPPPVALSANTVHMQSEEFEGEYNPKSASKNNNEPSGVKHKMGNILGGMKGALKNHKGSGVNMTVREIIVFAFYLMVLCIIAFSSKSTSRYYFTQAMTNLFVNVQNDDGLTFMDITDMEGVWRYMDEQLMDGLYWETEVGDDNSTEVGMVYYENRLLGKPKIRMLKVNNHSCTVVDSFSREIKECFSQYKKDEEDRDTIDIQAPDVLDGPDDYQMFEYRTAENLSTTDLWGEIATYGGGGFVAFLDIDSRQQAVDVISKLKANRWMDRGTRVVIVDFALYNANINLFCIATLMFELPATGGVIPTANFDSLTLIRYVSKWDYVILVCEGIFTAFVVFFVIELSVITIVLSLKRTHISEKRVNELVSDDLEFANLDDVVSACSLYNNFVAVLLFFAWIKIFKYISFNKTMSQLSATLSRSAKDIGGFAVMFFVFFFAYAQFGYLCFGTQNMFLAIINDTYVEVKGELEKQKNDFEVADFFKNKFYRVLRFLRLTKKEDPTESTANYGDWRQSLIERGYNDREINEKFAKFDITDDRTYTEDEKATVEAELEKEKNRKEEELTTTQRDYISVIRRVQLIEDAIKRVHSDVNVVLTRFETIEGRKVHAKENEVSTLARDVFNSADQGNSYDRP